MRSFVLACITIVAIGVGAHVAIDEIDPLGRTGSPNDSVRLD